MALLVLMSEGPSWFSLNDAAEQGFADWLGAAVKIEAAILFVHDGSLAKIFVDLTVQPHAAPAQRDRQLFATKFVLYCHKNASQNVSDNPLP